MKMIRVHLLPAVAAFLLANAPASAQDRPAPASPAPAAKPAEARNIRFQFDGIPYADVLERFAQMAGKPLLADTNVAGTLTFNDPNPYNYTEAFDMLNLILSMKGLMLVESGHYLRLVPFKELPAQPLRILRGLDHSGDVRPGEVVTVVLDVKSLESKEVADAIMPMLSNAGSVAPMGRGRGLIITDRLSNISRIRTLLATLDTEVAVDRQMKTYTLLHASGAIVSDLLNRTFGIATAPRRTTYNPNTKAMEVLPPDPNDYITAVYDDASRTLVLFGPRERIGLAEEMINKFEQKDGPGGDVRIYFPQTIKAEELANIIRQAIPGVAGANETAAAAATKARLISDTAQNRLIVAAPIPGQLEQIETLINRVDKPVHGPAGLTNVPLRSQTVQLTRVFRPRAAESTNLASILTQALTRRAPDGRVTTTASVSHDPGSQSVVVSGSPGDLQIASDIVTQLETGTTQPTPLQTRFIDVGTTTEAMRLQPLVEQLYRDQVGSGAASAVAHAKIMADAENGRLIVTASESHLEKIDGLVRQLRSDRGQPASRRLKILALQHARADAALASLNTLLAERMNEKRFADVPKPSLLADAPNNRLLLTATEDQIREIEAIVAVVDVAPAGKSRREMAVVPLTAKPAAEIVTLVTSLLGQLGDDPSRPAPALTADPGGKQIIVLAAPEDQARVRALIAQFDVTAATAAPRQFRGLELFGRSAAEFTPLVQQLYTEQLRGAPDPPGGPATLIPEAKQNRIMVSGSEKEIARVEAIIRQLDPQGARGVKEETRVVRLKAALAAEIAGLVEKSLNAQQTMVRVLVDARSNSLVVTGDPDAVAAASLVIAQLDTRSDVQPREMRVMELKQGDASAVATMATTLSTDLIKDQHGPDYVPQTKIVPDAASNRLVLTGPKDELNIVARVIEQLDQAPEASGGARVFKLVNADASQVVSVVSNAMLKFDNRNQPIRRVTISLDRESNSIIVAGPRNDLKDAETILQRLDNEGVDPSEGGATAASRARELKIIDVRGEDVDGLAALAMRVFSAQHAGRTVTNLVSITPEPNGRRLIVLAPAAVLPQVEAVITTLDSKPDQGTRELHTIELKNASASELLPTVQRIYGEQTAGKSGRPATIYPDASGTRFTVYGTRDQAAGIRQIVETLATQARVPRETRAFEVGSANDVQRLQPIVQQLYQDQWKGQSDPADAQILADPRTGRLIVTGRPEHLKQIEAILQQLGAGKARSEARDTRILDLTTASAVELAATVRTLYLEQAKARLGSQQPDTLITPDAGANRLIVVGDTNELNEVEALVQKLDRVSAQSATARVFKLKSADPQKVSEILATSLVRYDAYGRPQKRATVSVDAKTRTLIVTGDPKELTSVATIIEQLDQSLGVQPNRQMKVVSLDQGRVGELTGKLRQLYNDQLTAQPELSTSDVLIMEDTASNQFIFAGSDAQLALLEKILHDLQAAATARGERQTKFIEVGQVEELNRLMPLVQQLYMEQWKNRYASDPADANLLIDAKNGRFIVTGRTNHLAEIEALVARLRTSELGAPRDTRIYELTAANAAELSGTVRSLYLDQAKSRPAAQPQETLILPDSTSNRLIVSGTTNELAVVEDIIRKLDKVSGQSGTVRLFKLKSADPAKVMEVLGNALMSYDAYGRPRRRVGITVDAKTRTIVVAGDPKELQALQNASLIIEELDRALGEQAERRIRVVALKQGRAAELSPKLRQLYNDQLSAQPDLGTTDILIMEDTPANQLILAGSEPQLKLLERIIGDLQSSVLSQGARETKLFDAGGAEDATRLLPLVQQLYTDRWKSKDAGDPPDAQIVADAPNGRLVATGRTNHLAEIAAIVELLRATGAGSKREMQVISLQRHSAQALAAMLNQVYARQTNDPNDRVVIGALADDRTLVVEASEKTSTRVREVVNKLDGAGPEGHGVIQAVHLEKGQADSVAQAINSALADRVGAAAARRISVTPVAGANSLLIHGPTNAIEDVMKIVRELDTESDDAEIKVRIYKLENGTVKEVESVLNQVLQGVSFAGRRRGGRFTPASISTDERNNSLIVSGSEAHFKVVEQLLRTLDAKPERSEKDVQFVWLRRARAFDVASKLDAVFIGRPEGERPVIEPDLTANSLTLIGRRADLAQAQDLIARLDESSQDTGLQVRLRPLDRVPAEQMARMLTNIYPQMAPGRVRVVEKLEPPPRAPQTNAAPAPSTAAPATPPATNLTDRLQPEVVVAIDADANALLLSGPANQLDEIDRIINELSYSYITTDAEFRLFPLKEADPVLVARTLNELFKVEAPKAEQPARPGEPARPVQPPQPRMTVVAEPRTRGIIVRSRATDFILLESLIKQLDAAQITAQLEFRVVPLTNAQPEKVLPLVQQMVTQLNLVRPGDPLSVAVESRARGILIVARGPVMDQVERMIRGLDSPSVFAEAEVRVIALRKASATQLAAVLQSMLRPGAQGELTAEARELQEQVRRLKIQGDDGRAVLLDLTKPVRIMSDPLAGGTGGNRLILTSTPDNLTALAAVVGMLDSVALGEAVNVRVIRLQQADATAAAQTLTSVFSQGRQLAAAGPAGAAQPEGASGKALVNPLNIATDARNNAIILSGQKESLDLAVEILNDIDRDTERFVTEVRLFPLKYASAARLLPLLQSVFTEGPAVPGTEGLNTQVTRLRTVLDGRPRTTEQPKTRGALVLQSDETANILVVAARSDVLPLIEDVLKQLDVPAASGLSVVRLYPLKHADPVVVQKILNDLHSGPRSAAQRPEEKPVITLDDRTGTLIVAGPERTFTLLDTLLMSLDRELPLEMRDIRILPLAHADATDLAAQLQRLLDARVTQKSALGRGQAESLRVLIVGEPRSNSLLIGGSKDSFELVESLAKQLDQAPTALSGKIRLVVLQYADARNVATTLNNIFAQRYQAAKSPEVQRNKPVIVPDPRSNSLILGAGMDDNAMIDELVLKLDRKLDDPALQLAVLPLKHNDSGRMATTLENIFAARLAARTPVGEQPSPQDRIKIEADALNNSLIVSASRENLEAIQTLLQRLDVEPPVLGGVVQTFTLQYADAQRVANILRTLVDQGLYRPGALPGAAPKPAAGRDALAVTVDPRGNTLIVSASPENLAIVKTVIAQVDTKDFAETGNVKVYTLTNARASSLATVLDQFFRAKRAGEAAAVNAPERSVPVTIVPDDRSNTLLVTGTKEGFDVIERLLQQLDGEDARARLNFRVFPLRQATASKLQDTLRQLFANRPARVKGEPPEPISIVADAWVNALIVGASTDDMGMVTSLIERLDSDQGGPGLAVQVFPLAKADARRVAQIVQGLYRDGATTAAGQPVTVSADERMNAIVVSAGEADVRRVAELIRKLDTDQIARVSEIRVFPLRYARAESLATLLTTALNTKPTPLTEQNPNAQSVLQFITRTQGGGELVTSALKEAVLITPDARVNSLIVSAPVDYMGLLEQIITRLDNSSHQKAKIKVFNLVNADARQTAELLTSLFRLQAASTQIAGQRSIQYTLVKPVANEQDGRIDEAEVASAVLGTDEQSALTVTIDPRTNSLLVGGTEDYVALVSEIVASLDSSEAQERTTEVYRLRNAQAQEVATAIRNFLDQERQRVTQVLGAEAVGTAQRLLEREIAVVPEPVSNTLLLSASPRYFAQIKALIEDLDRPQPQVLIQVLVAEVGLDNALDLGLEWTYNGVPFAAGVEIDQAQWIQSGFSSAVSGGDYSFLFRALEEKGRLEVLSRPQIVTADNKPAEINIGQRIPLITDSRVTERGDTINSFRYENVGVNLRVTPRIAPDGFVTLEVGTTNSTVSSSTVKINEEAEVPIINQRIASTTVSVQSGQSILIGGLIGTFDDRRTRKVPLLGDIPVVGYLFRSSRNKQDRRELLILLTPQILTKAEAQAKTTDLKTMTEEQLRQSRINEEIKRDDMQRRILDPIFPQAPSSRPGTPPVKEYELDPAPGNGKPGGQ